MPLDRLILCINVKIIRIMPLDRLFIIIQNEYVAHCYYYVLDFVLSLQIFLR